MIAIIGGSSLLNTTLFSNLDTENITTSYGMVEIRKNNQLVFLQRHGINGNIPPHRINHQANIIAIQNLGISEIISVNSTGALTPNIHPGNILVPNDYINLFNVPTFFDNEMKFTVPGLDQGLRKLILEIAKLNHIKVIPKGVYFQVRGPTLETQAEIRMIKQFGDIVGMTMANEAILAKELDISYAAICTVDNYANGINNQELTLSEIHSAHDENLANVENLLTLIIDKFQ